MVKILALDSPRSPSADYFIQLLRRESHLDLDSCSTGLPGSSASTNCVMASASIPRASPADRRLAASLIRWLSSPSAQPRYGSSFRRSVQCGCLRRRCAPWRFVMPAWPRRLSPTPRSASSRPKGSPRQRLPLGVGDALHRLACRQCHRRPECWMIGAAPISVMKASAAQLCRSLRRRCIALPPAWGSSAAPCLNGEAAAPRRPRHR